MTEHAVEPCSNAKPHTSHVVLNKACPGVLPYDLPERLAVTLLNGGVFLSVDFAERRLSPEQARFLAVDLMRAADRCERGTAA